MHQRTVVVLAVALLVVLAISVFVPSAQDTVRLSGQTMGTTYNVTAVGAGLDREHLSESVEARLRHVNSILSNWDANSEVSRFSAGRSTGPFALSAEFAAVMDAAMQVHHQSDGYFDVTLSPLIELWGFGTRQGADTVPASKAIARAMTYIGQSRMLRFDASGPSLSKAHADVRLNLSAIAKGYGVDAVADALDQAGVAHFMVEIGGDLVARGLNPQGKPWRIGVEQPRLGADVLQLVVPVANRGLATSGDYRNYFENNGKRYAHILDPLTGRPVDHQTASATVIADNAMLADAWATAMLVLGREAGLAIAEALGIAVYFVERVPAGSDLEFVSAQSSAFDALLETE